VIPCLDALAAVRPKLPLAVLTNGDGAQQRAKLARFGILKRFDHVLVSSEIGAAKPDPAAFRAMADRLGASPADVLFVGDWLELDAEGATAAGLVGVWLDRTTSDTDGSGRTVSCPRITTLTQLGALVADGWRGPLVFPRGVGLGFTIAAAVGPISLLVVRRTLAEGRAYGLASGLGVATADATYGAIAAFGLTAVTSLLVDRRRPLALIGGLFLLWLAWTTARSVPGTATGRTTSIGGPRRIGGAICPVK